MAGSRWQWVRLKDQSLDQQILRPRFCLLLLRDPLPPSTDVTGVVDDEETCSQIDHRYKENR